MDPRMPPTPAQVRAKNFLDLVLGMTLFMPFNFGVLAMFGSSRGLGPGAVFAVATALIAYVAHRRGLRWHAAGLALGFAVMTVVTGGVCTLFTQKEYGEFAGLFYLFFIVVALIVAGIVRLVTAGGGGRQP